MENDCLLEMEGTVERVIFKNETNGYTVLDIKTQGESVIAVGIMPWINVGEGVLLIGRWKPHHNFGMQFFVEQYSRVMPSSCDNIKKYLSSGIIKGIGMLTAEKIVDEFGEETLDILENHPEKICKIKGITKLKAEKISSQLNEVINMKNISERLQKYGILHSEIIKIYKILGKNAVDIIEGNPYTLCAGGIDIDFDKADRIAQSLEKPEDNVYRIKSGILYVLRHNMNNGHTCLPITKLVEVVSEFLSLKNGLIIETIEEMIQSKELILDKFDENNFVFLPELYSSETYCALRVMMILKYYIHNEQDADDEINRIEALYKIKYAPLQREAIKLAVSGGIMILTGGPGTGKTTTLKAIIEILKNQGEKIFLAAPTGRAAQRMTEITGYEAKTIHRMLEVCWDAMNNPIFNKNERNLLDCDTLILDEASMVDLSLFEAVLRALPLGGRLIIVGDSAQLPPISAGDILRDLISSNLVPTVQLKEIFRQSQKSLIVLNAHRIVRGEMPDLSIKDNDFFFLQCMGLKAVQSTVVDLCNRRLPNSYGYSPIYDIQVVTPGRKGLLGSQELNILLQAAINPASSSKREISINGIILREQDKVMQTKNNYDIYWEKADGTCGEGIYNGDIGVIVEIDLNSSHIVVKYADKIAVYELGQAEDLELAYAITVHKSQGSEFEAVVIPIFGKNYRLYYRNLLYTAVTRAKSKLIIVGDKESVFYMVNNDRKTKRYSGLREFLCRENKNLNGD